MEHIIPVINDFSLNVSEQCTNPFIVHLIDEKYEFPLELTFGCHKRFECVCKSCAKKWRNKNFDKFRRGIQNMDHPRFLTLTLKYDKVTGICDDIKKMWEYRKYLFKCLKRKKYRIKSWMAVIELPNHIHIVYDGVYLPQKKLSELWTSITGDSWAVDIRDIGWGRSAKQLAGYMAKYMSKLSLYKPKDFEQYKHFKLSMTHGLDLEKRKMILQYHSFLDIGIEGWHRIGHYTYLDLCEDFFKKCEGII